MTSCSPRLLLALVFALTLIQANAFGQGSKVKSEYDPIEEKDRDRPDLRTKWMMRGREAPKGQSAAALRLRAHRQKMAARALREAAARAATPGTEGAVTAWTPLGPAPLISWSGQSYGANSGRITAVAIDPTDATGNTVYVGGAFGGVWKSTNAATANPADVIWAPLTDQQATLAVGAVSIKPNGSVLLVGTGEPNNALANYYGLGILHSTDGGLNWNLISTANGGALPLDGMGATKFAWGTGALSNTVVAGMFYTPEGIFDGKFTLASIPGFYTSADSGATWTYNPPQGSAVTPNDGVTDVVFNAAAGAFFGVVSYRGIYKSTDGTTWTRLAAQPGTITANCPVDVDDFNNCPIVRGQLAVVPGRNEMYVWFVDGNDVDKGIWRSTNGGASWTSISETGIAVCGDGAGCGTSQAFYNLEIAAVPDGTATDLYAGAVNLFKCKLASGASACSILDTSAKWINLTHVYGCSPTANLAHVHPDEHGLDFRVIGGKAVMYFGNDGGVYRALDGFTGLNSGTCTKPNNSAGIGFENLNTSSLGSLTQFVSFSSHPTNKDILLGGTQDNGSPATATATTSPVWQTAGRGDGGYNEINPTNPDQWFASHTFVDVEVCNLGTNCDPLDFESNLVVEGGDAKIGGDDGAFYTPYILDPQNPGELLLGTCRVWRGSTAGTGFTDLSGTFDGSLTCPGQGDLVRGLAAGGPISGGFSNVVYATTEGGGPLFGGFGEVWSTTNAAGGPTQFLNRTFNGPGATTINPNNYTISSVAVDKNDAAGTTAFVGIMGFLDAGTHIWKTTDGGVSWTAFGSTANGLPDAPVNALLVDSSVSPSQIYAGTDVGVFVSSVTAPNWSEVGPNAQPGAVGYLPNVAVTAIRLFNNAGTKRLRVSTYGRGIWEFALAVAPDFTNVISDSPQTIFPTQTAHFHGTLTALNGYNSPVNLTCTGTPPTTCTLPAQVTPTGGGASYTVNAAGAVGDYSFNAHGVGTDANTVTHDGAITLHVVDFGLTDPTPASVTAQQGGVSTSTTFDVTAAGAFAGAVTLSCSGLQLGESCNFQPQNTAHPTSGNPVTITLTISTTASSPTGNNFPITIHATTPNAPAEKTKNITLTVTEPDFKWSGGGSQQVLAGQTTPAYVFTATPTAATFPSQVNFSCTNLPAQTACNFSPASIAAGTVGAQTVNLTITTTGPNAAAAQNRHAGNRHPWLPLTLPIAGLILVPFARRLAPRRYALGALCLSLVLAGVLAACGGGGGGTPPPPPPISVTVSLKAGQPTSLFPNNTNWPLQTAEFAAVVNNSTNQTVTWAVTGGAANGTIDSNGVYRAPDVAAGLPPTVTVTATSQAGSKVGSAHETLNPVTLPGTYSNITATASDGVTTQSPTLTLTVN